MSEQVRAAQSWNPAQRHRHDPAVGQLNVHLLVLEVDGADACLAKKCVLVNRILNLVAPCQGRLPMTERS